VTSAKADSLTPDGGEINVNGEAVTDRSDGTAVDIAIVVVDDGGGGGGGGN